jgi:hypothetical protein
MVKSADGGKLGQQFEDFVEDQNFCRLLEAIQELRKLTEREPGLFFDTRLAHTIG